jgi:phenylpyruvate tautomerase PptA (4-oxalocrotonate tautomerase family)
VTVRETTDEPARRTDEPCRRPVLLSAQSLTSRGLNLQKGLVIPLVKVNLLKGRSAEEKDSIAASIQTALVSTLEVPDANRYQLFNEYDRESFRHTSGYLGMTYTDQLLIIEITVREGDDDEAKKSLLAEINRNLVAAGVVGGGDVFVLITEIGRANVSFGKGLAQRAPSSQSAG